MNKEETNKTTVELYNELCSELYDLCMESLPKLDVVDVMDALSVVKNRIINDSMFVTAEMIIDDKLEETLANLSNVNHKNHSQKNVGA